MSRFGSVEDLRRGITFGRGYGKCESRLGDVGVADLTQSSRRESSCTSWLRRVFFSKERESFFIGANFLKIIISQIFASSLA